MRAAPTIIPATLGHTDKLVDVLVRAFDKDPPANWIMRNDARRAEAFQRFFGWPTHK